MKIIKELRGKNELEMFVISSNEPNFIFILPGIHQKHKNQNIIRNKHYFSSSNKQSRKLLKKE